MQEYKEARAQPRCDGRGMKKIKQESTRKDSYLFDVYEGLKLLRCRAEAHLVIFGFIQCHHPPTTVLQATFSLRLSGPHDPPLSPFVLSTKTSKRHSTTRLSSKDFYTPSPGSPTAPRIGPPNEVDPFTMQ